MKRLSSLHAVSVSTPIKIRIIEVKKQSETPQSTGDSEASLDQYVYTIEINSRGEYKVVEKDLQEIVDLFTSFDESFPGQVDGSLLQTIANDD